MRGKDIKLTLNAGQLRITPAYAGKSGLDAAQRLLNQDHPRVCGEKQIISCGNVVFLGSPPRMRGKAPLIFCGICGKGITPAYAGKSMCG